MKEAKWKLLRFFHLERAQWNVEWALGRWDSLDDRIDPVSIELVRKYARGGPIVEHGCGGGALIKRVGDSYYQSYTGMDISYKAIQRATASSPRSCIFRTIRMEDWPGSPARLIIIQEALYYLEPLKQRKLIELCTACVGPDGALYIKVHDSIQFKPLLDLVRQAGSVLEERRFTDGPWEGTHIVIAGRAAQSPCTIMPAVSPW